jgi:ribonuclease HII
MSDLLQFDQAFKMPVCGIDEVGRGPLAGPVVAACVIIPDGALSKAPDLLECKDSKALSAKKREVLFDVISQYCIWGLGEANPDEIDRINILQASFRAMERAAENMISRLLKKEISSFLAQQYELSALNTNGKLEDFIALVDGNKMPPHLPFARTQNVIKGDGKSLAIAAASILAKVTRDRFMQKISLEHSEYKWYSNNGYGSKAHLEAIDRYGPTPHHRMSFAPLKYIQCA